MSELVEFLRQRLNEDEQIARAAVGQIDEQMSWAEVSIEEARRHIDHYSPERALAEVEAKRKLIEQHLGYYGAGDDEFWPVQTLRLLALPYANHPEFKEEWRP